MNRITLSLFLAVLLAVGGCARYVLKEPTSGVVAIPSASNAWPFRMRNKAEALMSQHFPEGYVVVSEGEAVIGETTDVDKTAFGGKRATTTDKTEWRIHYRRANNSGYATANYDVEPSSQPIRPASFENRQSR